MPFLNRSHRVATICGAAPLLLGTGIFLVWLIVRWDWLAIAGGVVLYAALAAVAVGVVALARCCWVAVRPRSVPRRHVRVSALWCAGLLANFPVAAGVLWAAIAIATRYTVLVHNASQESLDRVRVIGGGCDASFGSLQPGAAARRSFWVRQDGELVFRASSGDDTLDQLIDPYVTPGGGGHLTVTVEPDKRIGLTRQAADQLAWLDRIRDSMAWLDRARCAGRE